MRWALLLIAACTPAPVAPAPHAPLAPLAIDPSPPPGFADPGRAAKLAATAPALDALLDAQRTAQHIPGLAFGVVVDGALVYARGVGVLDLDHPAPVDADTVFRIGSMTKTLTSLAILQLRDRGKLALDDALARWLPELAAIRYPTRDAVPFTIRHVLTHTTGLPPVGAFSFTGTERDLTERDMLAGLDTITLAATPGTTYVYSNFAMSLLGLVIQRATGTRYRDWVNAEILAPLGMRSSTWDPPRDHLATPYGAGPAKVARWRLGMAEAAGGLYSTLHDMARYAAFQLAAYPPRDGADTGPLRRASVREAHAVQHAVGVVVRPSQDHEETRAEGIGLGWWSYASCELEQVVRHTGGADGYRGELRLLPQRGVALILLTNFVDTDSGAILDGATEILRASGGLIPRTSPPSPAIQHAIAGLVDLYASFSDAKYAALFGEVFRAAVTPTQAAHLEASLATKHGACTRPQILAVDSAVEARFAVGCERGHLEYTMTLDASGLIIAANVGSFPEAAANPSLCATRTSM